jgi:hypothetical protein
MSAPLASFESADDEPSCVELPPECPTWAVPSLWAEASPDDTSLSSEEFAVVTLVSA